MPYLAISLHWVTLWRVSLLRCCRGGGRSIASSFGVPNTLLSLCFGGRGYAAVAAGSRFVLPDVGVLAFCCPHRSYIRYRQGGGRSTILVALCRLLSRFVVGGR